MSRPTFGQRLPRPRTIRPVPLHQMRLDTVLRVASTRTGTLLYLLPGGLPGGAPAPEPVAAR